MAYAYLHRQTYNEIWFDARRTAIRFVIRPVGTTSGTVNAELPLLIQPVAARYTPMRIK
ncbi:protein of unknown function (plasmid) [Caballeronia sp. S22]